MATREQHEAIGAAVERAAAELPEGCDLYIEIERHAGNVVLYLPNSDATKSDFEADTFAGQINKAIDWAKENCEAPEQCGKESNGIACSLPKGSKCPDCSGSGHQIGEGD